MRAANQLVARVLEALRPLVVPGATTAIDRRRGRAPRPRRRRRAGVQGLSRVSGDGLRLGQPRGGARHPGAARAARGGHPLARHGRQAGRVLRRLRRDAAGRADRGRRRAAAGRDPGRAGAGHRRRCGSAAGCRTSATPSRRTSRRTGIRWCASSSATASAPRSTRSRRCRTTGRPGRGPRLAEGMVLAIEPMVNMGKPAVKVLADGWTAVTSDGSLSAHFEHSVAVTSAGPWILTALPAPRRAAARQRPRAGSEAGMSAGRGWPPRPAARRRRGRGRGRGPAAVRALPGAAGGRRAGQPAGRQAGAAHGTVTAHLSADPRRNFVRILTGDRVRVRLSPRDLTRGAIVAAGPGWPG